MRTNQLHTRAHRLIRNRSILASCFILTKRALGKVIGHSETASDTYNVLRAGAPKAAIHFTSEKLVEVSIVHLGDDSTTT